MYRLPSELWMQIVTVLVINLLVVAAYITGMKIINMMRIQSWPSLAQKPLPVPLRSHLIWGLIAASAMFLGSLNGLRHGATGWLPVTALIFAVLLVLTGVIRVYFGGSGWLHMVVALAGIAVFGWRLANTVPSLAAAVIELGRPAAEIPAAEPAAASPEPIEFTLATSVVAPGTSSTPEPGSVRWENIKLRGTVTGASDPALNGVWELEFNQVLLPPGKQPDLIGQIQGAVVVAEPAGAVPAGQVPLRYRGTLRGLVRPSGTVELLIGLDGLGLQAIAEKNGHIEFVGLTTNAPGQPGFNAPIHLRGRRISGPTETVDFAAPAAPFGTAGTLQSPGANPGAAPAAPAPRRRRIQSGC